MARLTLVCALLAAVTARSGAAPDAPQHLHGIVLSVLSDRREAVVRQDASGSTPALTTLFHLARDVNIGALHAGDNIVARSVTQPKGPVLEDVRVVPAPLAPNVLRSVRLLQVGEPMPAARFIDQTAHAFGFDDFRGKSVVLAFVYTRCPDPKECPLISSNFHTLQTRFGNGPYHLVEMTLDPAFDQPPVLARYGKLFGADAKRWTLGTGKPDTVLGFEARFGIEPFFDPRVGLIHTERTALIGPDGKIIDFIDQAGWNADDIVARLQAAQAMPSNPLARLDFELSKVAVAVCGNRVAGFSGLADLAIVLVIFTGGGWALQRLARKIFAEQS